MDEADTPAAEISAPTAQRMFAMGTLVKIAASIIAIGGMTLGVRLAPCVATAGSFGWQTWTRVAPNLACAVDLSGTDITEAAIDARIGAFTNMESLNLSRMKLAALPASVTRMTHLKTLVLDDNTLESLPDDLHALTSLTTLSARNNAIKTLPSMKGLENLTSIDLSGNRLQTLSNDFGSLSQLEHANVSNNELTSVTGLQSLDNVQSLDLSLNALTYDDQQAIQDDLPDVPIIFIVDQPLDAVTATSSSPTTEDASSSDFSSEPSGSAPPESSSSDAPNPQDTDIGCIRNFSFHGYDFCIPDGWEGDTTDTGVNFTDENGYDVAIMRCPMQETDYREWSLAMRSRTYMKNGQLHGADEWTGTGQGGDGTIGLLIVFMHMHDMNSWFGNNYSDIGFSCQIESLQPDVDRNNFRLLYLSVH